jgi:hypothetical protein
MHANQGAGPCLEGSAAGPFMGVPCASFFAASNTPIPGVHALHGRCFSLGSCRCSTWGGVGCTDHDGSSTRVVGVGSLRWHQMPKYRTATSGSRIFLANAIYSCLGYSKRLPPAFPGGLEFQWINKICGVLSRAVEALCGGCCLES